MYYFKISIILFTNIFLRMCKTEENLPVNRSRTKSNQELANCVCFPEGESLYSELLNPQNNGLQRLVVYLYRDINTNEIKVFTPDPEKQAKIPNIPVTAADEIKTIISESVASHMTNAPNNIPNMDLGNTNGDYIEIIPGHQQISQEMYQQPENNKQNNAFIEAQNRLITFSDLYQSNNLSPQRLKKLTEVFNPLKAFFVKKPKESLSYLRVDPKLPLNPYEETKEPNKKLTFDQWFNQQMEVFTDNKATQAIHTLNTDILKPLVQKVLSENNMNIDSTGLITDLDGVSVNLHKLELRSILIGSPVTYPQVLQGDLPLADNLPYLEGILLTMRNPPRILGVIPLKNEYYASQSDSAMSSNSHDVNKDHYFLAPKSYIDNELNYHPSSTSSDVNKFDTSSTLTPLKSEQDSKVTHNNDPPKNVAPSSEINEVSTKQHDNWLHSLLKAVVDSSKKNIVDASKRLKNEQKQMITESNKDQKHQIIRDSDAGKNVHPSDLHSRRMNYDLDPQEQPKDSTVLKYNEYISVTPSAQVTLPLGEDSVNYQDVYSFPYSNPDSHLSQRVTSPFNSNLPWQSDWYSNSHNKKLPNLKLDNLNSQTTSSEKNLAAMPPFHRTHYFNRNMPYRINTYNISPNDYIKKMLNPTRNWSPYQNIQIPPYTIDSPYNGDWIPSKSFDWQNYFSNDTPPAQETYPIKFTPCDDKLNSVCSVSTSDLNQFNFNPAPYNHFDFQPNSESSYVNTIPFSITSDALVPTNTDKWRIPYTDLKGPLYSDPHNMQPHVMTIPNKIIDEPQKIYPKIISSSYKSSNQTPYYDIDWIPPINKRLPTSDSTVETDSPLSANEETGSNIIKSPPADTFNLDYPVINTRNPYLTFDSSNSNLNLIHDNPLIFLHAGEKSIHPGLHVYTKPKNSGWQTHGLFKNVKLPWGWNNGEPHNNVMSKNLIDISNPRYLYGKHIFKSNSFENNNKNKILGYSNNMEQNRRQNVNAYAKPIIKSVINTFLEPFQYVDDTISQRNGDEATITVDNTTKKPDTGDGNRPEYRIIGGSPATGSGSPLNNKGRSVFK